MNAVFPTAACLAGLLMVFAGGPAAAGDDAHAVERLSFANGQTGHRYRVSILRPAAPPPADGYPVLFLLDGNAAEQDLTQTGALATPEGRAVAIDGQTVAHSAAIKVNSLQSPRWPMRNTLPATLPRP